MLKVKDYKEEFQKLGISDEEGKILLEFLRELAEIGISHFMMKEKECDKV